MANNTQLNQGTGGDVIATEDISGVKHELVKVEFGADGAATKVSAADPLPVTDDAAETSLASIDTKLSGTITISGTVSTGLTQPTTPSDTQPVSAASLPLPTGAATGAKQDTGNTYLASIDTKLTNPLPVSAGSLPLPSGAATSAKQDTGNTSLASIDGKITAVNTGAVVISSALPAGNNNIGDVDVASLPALAAGNNNIGDVDIASIAAGDNNIGNVDIVTLPSLIAGSAIIGKVGIDQTTPGTTNGVQVNAALPAGTNAIGKLAANSGVDIGDVDVTSVSGNVTVIQGTATNLKVQSENYQGGSAVGSGNALEVNVRSSTVALDTKDKPDSSSNYALTNVSSTALEASHVLKNGAGYLFMVTGYNNRTTEQFIQLHNTTSVPADTAVPVLIFKVAAGSNFALDLGKYGRYFSTGISICNSSTAATKTVGSSDCWFDAQVI